MIAMACVLSLMNHLQLQPNQKNQPTYKYVLDTARLVGIARKDSVLIGQLDENGEFNQLNRLVTSSVQGTGVAVAIYSGPNYVHLNTNFLGTIKVYEYRSGILIPGSMEPAGSFVPSTEEKNIKFSDYEYSKESPRIWNLPGTFVKVP